MKIKSVLKSVYNWLSRWGWFVTLAIVLPISIYQSCTEPQPAIDYHRGSVSAWSELLHGLQVQHEALAADLDTVDAARVEAVATYADDTEALCAALDRLGRM